MTRDCLFRTPEADEFLTDEGCYILEHLNAEADPQASIARARVPPGATTRWHRMLHTTERYLILEGQGRAEMGDASPFDVGPGDAILIPAGTPQRIANTGADDLVFLAICTPRFRQENYADGRGAA